MSFNYLTPSGIVLFDSEQTLAEVKSEYKQAFGENLVTTPESPQGVLISAETTARNSCGELVASALNQLNPNIAEGVFLDAIISLLGGQRIGASNTMIEIQCIGIPLTTIPAGIQIQSNETFQLFVNPNSFTFDSEGEAVVVFVAVNSGQINANPDTVNQIVMPYVGLESVNNSAAPFLVGSPSQTDQQARIYRNTILGVQGSTLAQNMIAAVSSVPEVQAPPYFYENPKSEPLVITFPDSSSITIAKNSIYMCVNSINGKNDDNDWLLSVAKAIYASKSGGCNYNNGFSDSPRSIDVTDPASGQIQTVLFDTPNIVQILIQVVIQINSTITSPLKQIQDAIINYANGLYQNQPGFIVGTSVSSFDISGAVLGQIPGINIKSLQCAVASGSPSFSSDLIFIKPFEIAKTQPSSITLIQTS